MSDFVDFQLSLSTAEEERNVFVDAPEHQPERSAAPRPSILPPGMYRVVAGAIYQVRSGFPQDEPPLKKA
jgi:predicted nucleic acid-binding protein